MPFLEMHETKLEVNEEGFLANPDQWNTEIASFLAGEDGINELNEEHWAVINYIRDYYLEKKLAPMVRLICKTTGFKLKHIYELFPSGPAKGAAKIAGLPKPDGCV